MLSFPRVRRPPAGSLNGVQVLGIAVLVGLGMAHNWRFDSNGSGGIASQVQILAGLRVRARFFFSYSSLSPFLGLEGGMPVVASREVFKPRNIEDQNVYEHGIVDDKCRGG